MSKNLTPKNLNLETLQGNVQSLPEAWIDWLFMKFEARWGALWIDRYSAVNVDVLVETWAEDLGDLTQEQLRAGYLASRDLKFPPTIGEFRALCKDDALNRDAESFKPFQPLPRSQNNDIAKVQEMIAKISAQLSGK